MRLQLRRQLLEELHHRRRGARYSFLVYSRLYSKKRAVERYTAPSHPITPLQSYTAYMQLIQLIQLIQRAVYYTAIQLIQYTALYTHPLAVADVTDRAE